MAAARDVHDETLKAIAERVAQDLEGFVAATVGRYREEIPDYTTVNPAIVEDVTHLTRVNTVALLRNVSTGELLRPEEIELSRDALARRAHHGVSLESALQAIRLWSQCIWAAVVAAVRVDEPDELRAALYIGGRIIEHLHVISRVAEQGYVDEVRSLVGEREIVRRDLLEALISGKTTADTTRRQSELLEIKLVEHYVVVVARGAELAVTDVRPAGSGLWATREAVTRHLHHEGLLVGVRHAEVVALYPVTGYDDLEDVKSQCAELGETLQPIGAKVGIGGWHPGHAGIVESYAEAREAVTQGLRAGHSTSLVAFDDILVERLLRSSTGPHRLLEHTVQRLRDYDARRKSALIETLRTYLQTGSSLARSAAQLHVHPNTITYRLTRIREITGRDPAKPDDLLVLALTIKLADLPPDGDAVR